jgi:hypothetical protein
MKRTKERICVGARHQRGVPARGTGDRAVGAGAALATIAVCGAALTLGLVQRWGEDFPR